MTKEEAKHLSDVLKVYSEGKKIQVFDETSDGWLGLPDNPTFRNKPFKYRIKPEPKLRPYKNSEEFLKAQKEHGDMLYNRVNGEYHHPVQVRNGGINVMYENNTKYHTFAELLKSSYNYTWQDGAKCGIIED